MERNPNEVVMQPPRFDQLNVSHSAHNASLIVGQNQMKSLRILVVEDDAVIAMLLRELLAGIGHEVCETAANQRDAVAAAAHHKLT